MFSGRASVLAYMCTRIFWIKISYLQHLKQATHSVQREMATHSVQREMATHSVQREMATHSVQREMVTH